MLEFQAKNNAANTLFGSKIRFRIHIKRDALQKNVKMYDFFQSRDPSPPTIRNHKQNVSCEGFLKPWIESIIEM